MGEILNGKKATIEALNLPKTAGSIETLDTTTPYMQVLDFSVNSGTEIIEHQLVGDDKKIFDAGVKNATVTLTILANPSYGVTPTVIYTLLQNIKDNPISRDASATPAFAVGPCDDAADIYYIKITINDAADSNVFGMEPATGSWGACEISDLSFPANDSIRFTLTIRYGELDYTSGV
jgi:hypothetical protein